MTDQEINAFILDNQGIVYGALKKISIKPSHPDYEELVQEGFLKLLQLLKQYQPNKNKLNRFRGFVFTKLRWFLNEKRHELNYCRELLTLTDTDLDHQEMDQLEDQILFKQWITDYLASLSEREKRFAAELFLHEKSVAQIARDLNVSRSGIYKWRNHLKQAFRRFE